MEKAGPVTIALVNAMEAAQLLPRPQCLRRWRRRRGSRQRGSRRCIRRISARHRLATRRRHRHRPGRKHGAEVADPCGDRRGAGQLDPVSVNGAFHGRCLTTADAQQSRAAFPCIPLPCLTVRRAPETKPPMTDATKCPNCSSRACLSGPRSLGLPGMRAHEWSAEADAARGCAGRRRACAMPMAMCWPTATVSS